MYDETSDPDSLRNILSQWFIDGNPYNALQDDTGVITKSQK